MIPDYLPPELQLTSIFLAWDECEQIIVVYPHNLCSHSVPIHQIKIYPMSSHCRGLSTV